MRSDTGSFKKIKIYYWRDLCYCTYCQQHTENNHSSMEHQFIPGVHVMCHVYIFTSSHLHINTSTLYYLSLSIIYRISFDSFHLRHLNHLFFFLFFLFAVQNFFVGLLHFILQTPCSNTTQKNTHRKGYSTRS